MISLSSGRETLTSYGNLKYEAVWFVTPNRSQNAHENPRSDLYLQYVNVPGSTREYRKENLPTKLARIFPRFLFSRHGRSPLKAIYRADINKNFGTITASIARELNISSRGWKASSWSEPRALERVNGAEGLRECARRRETTGEMSAKGESGRKLRGW